MEEEGEEGEEESEGEEGEEGEGAVCVKEEDETEDEDRVDKETIESALEVEVEVEVEFDAVTWAFLLVTWMPVTVNVWPAKLHSASDMVCIKASLKDVVIVWPVTPLPNSNPYVIIMWE